MDELTETLAKVGAEVIGEEPVDFERCGLVFNRRIRTRIKVYMKDRTFYERFFNDIKDTFNKYDLKMRESLVRELRIAAERYANIEAEDLVDVLVSDGETHTESNCIYLGGIGSGHKPFSEFNSDAFWSNMEYYGGVARPQNTQND